MLGIIGNLAAYILPVIVGGIVDYLNLTVQQAGYAATAEMAGLGIGAFSFSFVILKVSWRFFALLALILVTVANIITPHLNDPYMLMAVRLLAGIGGGMLLGVGNSGLASTTAPERIMGMVVVLSMLVAALALYIFPLLLAADGIKTMFFAIAGINVFLSLFVFGVPARSPYSANQQAAQEHGSESVVGSNDIASSRLRWIALAAVLLFFMAAMSFWAYVERVGSASEYPVEFIARVLGSSQLAGAAGALLPVFLALRLGGRLIPMSGCICLAMCCSILMIGGIGNYGYAIAACGFIFAWDAFYPYLMGLLISLDRSAKLVSYGLGVQTLGKSVGPAVGALLIAGDDFDAVYWFCLVCFAVCLLLFFPAISYSDKFIRAGERK